jgi:hypothetical protein
VIELIEIAVPEQCGELIEELPDMKGDPDFFLFSHFLIPLTVMM